MKLAVIAVLIAGLMLPLDGSVTWDPQLCRNAAFASQHKDLCGDPILNGGGPSSGSCGGLCGVVKGVLGHIPGLGGLL